MLEALGDGGVEDHYSGYSGGGRKNFLYFAHVKTLKVIFFLFSFFLPSFLSLLSLIFPHSLPRSFCNLSDAVPFS